jgi:transcriptional regulator with XRE-family HTH domain
MMARAVVSQERHATASEIGLRLRWARQVQELSRKQLANLAGVDLSTIKYLETGRRAPSIFLLMSLTHILGIDANYLLAAQTHGLHEELRAKLLSAHPEIRRQGVRTGGATGSLQKRGRSSARSKIDH